MKAGIYAVGELFNACTSYLTDTVLKVMEALSKRDSASVSSASMGESKYESLRNRLLKDAQFLGPLADSCSDNRARSGNLRLSHREELKSSDSGVGVTGTSGHGRMASPTPVNRHREEESKEKPGDQSMDRHQDADQEQFFQLTENDQNYITSLVSGRMSELGLDPTDTELQDIDM